MNRDMIRPPMVFIGPPGYQGNVWIVDCDLCKGKHSHHGKLIEPCQTCGGMGVVAVPRREPNSS